MKKDTYYFPHDFHARNDPKLIKLAMLKLEYKAIYWDIIEMLHEQGGYLELDCVGIAYALRTDCDSIATVINFPDLFKIEGNRFTTKRVLENLEKKTALFNRYRELALKRWDKDGISNSMPTHMRTQCKKVNKSKVKEVYNISNIIKENHFFGNTVFNETYNNYLTMRIKIKKPATDKAQELILKKLSELSNNDVSIAIKILEQSILNSWQGVFALKQDKLQPEGGVWNSKL